MKRIAILFMIAAFSVGFFVVPTFAMDEYATDVYTEKPNYWSTSKGDAILFDLLLLRPLGFASIGVGLAATIVALPFSITGNNTREVGEALLGEAGKFTLVRPLGEVFPPQEYLDR